jgi:hypothetical protein
MKTRQTFPQEWRFETLAECKAAGFEETCVAGDFAYIAELYTILTCPKKDGGAAWYMGDCSVEDRKCRKELEFDLRPDNLPRTCLNRSHAFDGEYFMRLSSRWPNITFVVVVAAHDLGLPPFFGRGGFPWRQWASFTFWFKGDRLTKTCVNFEFPLLASSVPSGGGGGGGGGGSGMQRIHGLPKDYTSANPWIALTKTKQFYETWRQYRRVRVVQWARDGGIMADYWVNNALLNRHIESTLVDEQGHGHYRFFHLDRRTQELHDFVKSMIASYSLNILVNESLPLGMQGTFVDGFTFTRCRDPSKERAWSEEILELTLALAPLALPAYVLLWIYEWLHEDTTALPELARIRLIQGVIESRQRVLLATTKPTH